MGIEGGLVITLKPSKTRPGRVTIGSTRPVHASQLFRGKGIEETLKLVPMLFTVCGTAQACAAVRACEQALGHAPTPWVERIREGLVALESIREHLWRILLDWSAYLGERPQQGGMVQMLALQRDICQALSGQNDPFQPAARFDSEVELSGEMGQRLLETVGEAVFAMTPSEWLTIDSEAGLDAWASGGNSVAARLVAQVMKKRWSGIGRSKVEALPILENGPLHLAMQSNGFIERPQWEGCCYETTSLSRSDSALLQSLRGVYGNGLLVRLVARLTELAQRVVNPLPQESHYVFAQAQAGAGIGRVTAARGELLHRVIIEGDRVADYRIVAPTEWNFHPQGVVVASLATLQGDDIEPQARLLINAIDPCVAYELRIG